MLNKKPIALAIVITISHLAHADLTTGLIAHYPFNGNANDVSGNGYNGTVHGATLTTDRLGAADAAYSFNNTNNYIDANLTIINTAASGQVTVAFWMYWNGIDDDGAMPIGFANNDDDIYILWSRTGYFGFNTGRSEVYGISNSELDNEWVHVAAIFMNGNATQSKLYINGIAQSLTLDGDTPFANSVGSNMYLGGHPSTYWDWSMFDGKIDDVRIYNRAITDAEAQEIYQGTVIATAPAISTDAPSLITATGAILKGTVNPNGADTLVNFDFGATTAYGQSLDATPGIIAATATATSVSAAKTGLTCGSTYHYRVTAVNSFGSTKGADKAFTTSACPRDLIVTNITLNPAKPVAGTAFSAVVTVKNQGTVATAASKLKLWPNLATVPVCTTAAPKIADIAALAAGASVNVTVSGLTSSVVGSNTFRSFADGTCVIGETNETNNQRTLSYRIGGRLPDLIITSITLTPAAPAKNTMFNAAITVKNQGTLLGTGFLDVWTNQATTANCGAVGNAWADVGALAAGASKVINLTGLSAGATAGAKTLRAFVDSWCETVESNEANNQLTKAYTVQ